MRIGGIEVSAASEIDTLRGEIIKLQQTTNSLKARAARYRQEIGGTGTTSYGGYLDEEWNALLRSGKWYEVSDKMCMGDAQCQATWLAISLPIRSAKFRIKPASEDKADVDIAQVIEDNLFGGMVHSFDDFLRQALLHLRYGSIGFEPVYEVRGGLFLWRKFATRLPETFYKYNINPETEELTSITQQAMKAGKWVNKEIPTDRLMLFINNLEGANYKGWSIFRGAWKHWKIKDMLYKLNAIAMERWATGILRIRASEGGIGIFDEDKAFDIGKTLRSSELAVLIEPSGYATDILFPSGTMPDPLPMIQHHNKMITQAALASFINLGQDRVGSYALSRDQKDVFFLSIQAVVKYFQGIMDQRIRELVDFNWNVRGNYPTITVENLQAKDLKTISTALFQLANSGNITPGPELEEWTRNIFGMPDLPEEQREQVSSFEGRGSIALQDPPKYVPWRELRPEEKFLDLDGINAKLTGVEDRFTDIAKALRREQIKIMLERGLRALMKKTDKDFYDAVDAIKVPYFAKMKEELQTVLKDVYLYGKQSIKDEMGRQGAKRLQRETFDPVEGDAASNRYLGKVAERSTEEINKGLLATLAFGVYGLHRQGSTDLGPLRMRMESRSDREIKRAAALSVSTAFNMGRDTTAKAAVKAGEISETAVFSAIMDSNTCDNCADIDGREVEVGSAEYEDIYPPLQSSSGACLGGGNCRCVMIFLAAEKAA